MLREKFPDIHNCIKELGAVHGVDEGAWQVTEQQKNDGVLFPFFLYFI